MMQDTNCQHLDHSPNSFYPTSKATGTRANVAVNTAVFSFFIGVGKIVSVVKLKGSLQKEYLKLLSRGFV